MATPNLPPKNKRGRPRRPGRVVAVPLGTLLLYAGEDDDLIRFFQSLPLGKRRAGLKAALRAGGMQTIKVEDLTDDEEFEDAAEAFLE